MGSSMKITNNTYKSYIKHILKYGGEILNTTEKAPLKKLEKCHNNSLRLITGTVQTMSINALLVGS